MSAPVLQQHKHGSSSATNKYGSHTSLVDVEHLAGGTAHVSVELYVPRSGAHTKDTFWPCTFNLSKVILVSLWLFGSCLNCFCEADVCLCGCAVLRQEEQQPRPPHQQHHCG